MEKVDVVVIGAGTGGSNTAKAAVAAGAKKVIMVHPPHLINTCVEEGCMPSKSILAGAHKGEPLSDILATRDAHVVRLLKALKGGFAAGAYEEVEATAKFLSDTTIEFTDETGNVTELGAASIVIATGSTPFVPPIPGLDQIGDKLMISDHVVSRHHHFETTPKRILTIGGGPIGLELSTFFHDLGSEVTVLQRGAALGLFDPEFGEERVRASKDESSFPIRLNSELRSVTLDGAEVVCSIEDHGKMHEERYDAVLVATGRKANLENLGLENTSIELDERKNIIHDDHMQTSVPNIYIAGDVTGHHQILHFAAEMGKVAGHNAAVRKPEKTINYDRHMLAVSFDQFPSALIGLTETETAKRGLETVTATRNFNEIGLGILKRQEYGMWKIVAEKATGKILGSQVLGPDSSGELVQLLVPILANQNTAADIINMTWYHPTYAEILLSLARDIESARSC